MYCIALQSNDDIDNGDGDDKGTDMRFEEDLYDDDEKDEDDDGEYKKGEEDDRMRLMMKRMMISKNKTKLG